MGKFREHGLMLFLDTELYLGFIKMQADKSLGRSYAGLLAYTEGLYRLGYISKESYEEHKERYSQPLEKPKKVPTLKQYRERKALKKLEKAFSTAIKNWDIMSIKNKNYYIEKAREHRDTIPNAKLLLGLRKEPVISHD